MKRHFTLVEVLIAMGICVVGVCSIMALFPVGLTTARDANAANLASGMATQMLHLVKACLVSEGIKEYQARDYFQRLTGFTKTIDTSTYTAQTKPAGSDEPTDDSGWTDITEANPTSLSDFNKLVRTFVGELDGSLYCCSNDRLYKLVSGSNEDLECVVRLWAEPIPLKLGTSKDAVSKLPRSARFHVEVSWPAQRSYGKRQKLEYSMDIYCPRRDPPAEEPATP